VNDVSRETPRPAELEAEPAAAADVFGDRIGLARRLASDLERYGETLGLIGPLELPRLWTRHLINCALPAPLFRPGRVGDIGSGAGLPGLVLAIARPDVSFVLIEPMERRTAWLEDEAERLGLDNVEVIRSRAEDAPVVESLDQVTARAVTALSKLIPMTAPLLKLGGEMVFMKGERVAAEVDAAARVIRKNKLRDVEVLVLGEGVTTEVTRVFRATVD
jgi:16S rRNA (guanine527-N7)-methyltransferase